MYNVCYAISPIHPDMPDDMLIALNEAAVEGLALINGVILNYYGIPALYDLKPIYQVSETERWRDIGAILTEKNKKGKRWGDCKDFTAWRLAELRKQNVQCSAESIVYRMKNRLQFHTYVRYQNGGVEDPARELGMP